MSSFLKHIKDFYNKTYMDYSTGDVDLFEFYINFYYFAKAFQVLENQPKSTWTYFSSIFVGFCGSLACTLCIMSIYQGVNEFDLSYITEFMTYLSVMIYKLLILFSVKINLTHYHNFLREIKEDFRYVCNEGFKYRDRYFKNQLLTWKASLLAAIFTAAIGIGMILFATFSLIFYLYMHESGDRGNRPLPFQFWFFDIDLQLTPAYEITFVLGCSFITSHVLMYLFIIQANVIWVRTITSKADLVIWSIQDLLDDIRPVCDEDDERRFTWMLKERMRDIVIRHHSMYNLINDYSGVFKKFLLYEQKLSAPMVCLTAYCTIESLDAGHLNVITLLLLISIIVIVFIPSYLCTFLSDKIKSICDACWDIPFWKAGPLMKVIKPYLVLIMQKSLRPLVLQAAGFQDLSIQTYSNNMATAYSWFNMLRQSNL